MAKYTEDDLKVELENKEYEYGFYTDIESETFPAGLNEDIVRTISQKKNEPHWMTEWRFEAFRIWQNMEDQNGPMFITRNPIFKQYPIILHPKRKTNMQV